MARIGYLILISGWVLVLADLLLLTGTAQRLAFALAALLVELLGLALLAQHYRAQQTDRQKEQP